MLSTSTETKKNVWTDPEERYTRGSEEHWNTLCSWRLQDYDTVGGKRRQTDRRDLWSNRRFGVAEARKRLARKKASRLPGPVVQPAVRGCRSKTKSWKELLLKPYDPTLNIRRDLLKMNTYHICMQHGSAKHQQYHFTKHNQFFTKHHQSLCHTTWELHITR